MEILKLKVGDLVCYKPSEDNKYANGEQQIGVVLRVIKDVNPLFMALENSEIYMHEYVVRWFVSGYTSTLLPFNLKKFKPPQEEK
tara:strand:+ start:218 stop:472 length:255 start_codon:yes stop_codon:yes gene_type:complete